VAFLPIIALSALPRIDRRLGHLGQQQIGRLPPAVRALPRAVIPPTHCGASDPIVLIHDYHFALLPRMVQRRLPNATIVTFWHIPWPNSETFGICPWREEIIDGLLGSAILGFHTQFHCNNFLEATDRFVESRIDRDSASVTAGDRETLIRPYCDRAAAVELIEIQGHWGPARVSMKVFACVWHITNSGCGAHGN
jgi:Glycosyltransferase family 20